MPVTRLIRENPIVVLSVALLALAGWVAVDLANTPAPRKKQAAVSDQAAEELPFPPNLSNPAPATSGSSAAGGIGLVPDPLAIMLPPGNTAVSVLLLPRLKPGMKRVEVENFLGPPTADRIQPVTVNNGRFTYCTGYELDDLGPAMTIRPIERRPRPAIPQPSGPRTLVALEFDASQPGHPLVEILYPDPLF